MTPRNEGQPLTIQIKQPVRVKFLKVRKGWIKRDGEWVRADVAIAKGK